MSFLDQKPRIATEHDLKLPWSGKRDGSSFRCGFCGHKFKVGDQWRCVYTNDSKVKGTQGNPFVCINCDADYEQLIQKLASTYEEFKNPKFWRLKRQYFLEEQEQE